MNEAQDGNSEILDAHEVVELESVDADVNAILDSLMFFIGGNVIAGKEKVAAVQRLRRVVAVGARPSPATIEAFAVRAGKRDKVARQLRKVYEGLLAGKGFRDTSGRPV